MIKRSKPMTNQELITRAKQYQKAAFAGYERYNILKETKGIISTTVENWADTQAAKASYFYQVAAGKIG